MLIYIVVVLLFACVGFFLLTFFSNNHSVQKGRNTAQATPPPTLALANTGPSDAHTKTISFPAFHISFRVPSDLKTNKEVDPSSEDTQIGANYIALYTPDAVIDPKKHIQIAGVRLSINIVSTKRTFADEKDIVPTTGIKEAATDMSVIPAHNSLLNKQNMKVYSFPSAKAWVYNAEALLKNGGNALDITFYCVDYSNSKGSPTCQKNLKDILPTIQR